MSFLPVQACKVIPQVTLAASRQQRDAAPQPCLAQELRVVGNQLRILPPEVGQLVQLRVLAADSNQLTILPGELRRCVLLAVAGVVPGIFLAYAAGRSMEALLAGVKPADALTMASAVGLSVLMTLLGSLAPTIRALRVDPITALRAE